jgi:hypothetical protein
MSDSPLSLPPGWPTDDHRARVAARARALRGRRLARRTTAGALAVVVLGGAVAVLHDRRSSRVNVITEPMTTTTTTRTTSLPAVRTVPAPKGWRVFDYGDARLAAPPGWTANRLPRGTAICGPDGPGGFILTGPGLGCASLVVEPIIPDRLPPRAAHTIHGIRLYLGFSSPTEVRYDVPQLGVTITVRGVDIAEPVLATLGPSARMVVLGGGPVPVLPDDWRTVTFDGITMRVPPSMPVRKLGPNNLPPGICFTQTFRQPGVLLGNGSALAVNCTFIPAGVVPVPTDGVWISTASDRSLRRLPGTVVDAPGLRLFFRIDNDPADPVLTIDPVNANSRLTNAQRQPVVRLGLGVDPAIARTILHSIRAAN